METEIDGTRFGVAPNESSWYYCAIVDYGAGETDYLDGYATGERPTRTALRKFTACSHSWVAGIMVVHVEDVESVSATRPVTCEKCDTVYGRPARKLYTILEWEVKATNK